MKIITKIPKNLLPRSKLYVNRGVRHTKGGGRCIIGHECHPLQVIPMSPTIQNINRTFQNYVSQGLSHFLSHRQSTIDLGVRLEQNYSSQPVLDHCVVVKAYRDYRVKRPRFSIQTPRITVSFPSSPRITT